MTLSMQASQTKVKTQCRIIGFYKPVKLRFLPILNPSASTTLNRTAGGGHLPYFLLLMSLITFKLIVTMFKCSGER